MSASGGDAGGSSDPASVAQGLENTMSSTSANVADSKATNEPNNAGASSNGTTSSSESVIDKSEKPSTSRGESISGENVQSSNSNSNAETPKRLSFREVIANIFEPDQDTSNAAESEMEVEISYEKIATSNELLKEAPVPSKTRKVNIFVENTGPKWYDVQGSNVTQTIDPTKLPEAFEFLPITGRPDYKEELPEFQMNKIREFVGSGLNDTEFLKLAKYCSPDHLKTGKEMITSNRMPKQGLVPYMVDFEPFINPEPSTSQAGNDLCVVKKFKMRLDRDTTNTYAKKLKYRGLRMMPLTSEDQDDIPGPPETQLEPGRDVLFRVRIYRPFPYNIRDKPSRIRHSVFSRDLVLLGRQYLSELRDRIVCANDLDMRLDVSERLDHPRARTARELFPSGFFFINNVFYVDTRPGCVDLTERVRQWARHKRGLGEFSRRDMCLTTLDQLRLRLGHPEVYVHQGNCEHLFTFSEIRLLAPREPLSLRHYPRHTAMSQNQTVYCTTCAEFGAKWIVTGCSRVPFDPAFFCETCLKLYLYIDDRKIGDFKVYSYRGNEINMLKPQG